MPPNVILSGTIKEFKAAIELNDVEKIIALLKSPSAEIEANIAADGNGALISASMNGNLDVVNQLLEFPDVVANIATFDNCALRWAAANGHLTVVNRLLEFPAVVANIAADGNGALRWAAQKGQLAVVNRLLEFPAVVTNVAAVKTDALRSAAANGHLAVVNRLLEFPAVVTNVAAANNYALKWAAAKGHLAVVNRLFVAMRPTDINIAIEQHPNLAPLYENFKKETGELFHKMVVVLSGLRQKGIPIDVGALILSQAIPTPYLTRARVGIEKAKKLVNEHFANLHKDIKMKDDVRFEQKRPHDLNRGFKRISHKEEVEVVRKGNDFIQAEEARRKKYNIGKR